MFRARCERSCIFKGKYWEAGEIYTGPETPPGHFTVLEGGKTPGETKKARHEAEQNDRP